MLRFYRLRRKPDRKKHTILKRAGEQKLLPRKVPRSNYPLSLSGIRKRGVEFRLDKSSGMARRPFLLFRRSASRLPLIGLRSQHTLLGNGGQTDPGNILRGIREGVLNKIPAVRSVCQARHERRRVLFASRVAGPRLRRSPGSGGTYKRTVDSETSCRVKK